MAIPVVIDSLAWIKKVDIGPVNEYLLRNKLTFVPRKMGPEEPKPIRLFATTKDHIGVPRFFWYSHKRNLFPGLDFQEDLSKVCLGGEIGHTERKFILRDDQAEMVEACKKYYERQIGGIVCAFTAFGKSLTSLSVAYELGRKTIVLLHRKRLAYQWQESCNRFFPEWKTGIIGDGKRQWEGCDVVFAVVQTLAHKASKPFPLEFWRYFGTLIVDEVHVFGAPYFAQVTPRFPCRYVLGMSGTVRRLDGMEDVFRFIIGNQFYKASEKNRLFAKIWVRRTPYESARFIDHLEKATLLNIIAASKKRNQFIAKDIVLALQRGRNPLVMSERIDMLTGISEYVDQYAKKLGMIVSNGMYIGGKTDAELEEASKANVVYSTLQLAKEGIDIVRLDTLFLVSPCVDPEQAIGRVCRRMEGKKEPIVCDYVDDSIKKFEDSYYKRLKLYKQIGFKVIGDE